MRRTVDSSGFDNTPCWVSSTATRGVGSSLARDVGGAFIVTFRFRPGRGAELSGHFFLSERGGGPVLFFPVMEAEYFRAAFAASAPGLLSSAAAS